jgi:hypothetical protein
MLIIRMANSAKLNRVQVYCTHKKLKKRELDWKHNESL